MQWSSWSKHVFERDDSHPISCAISRQEKGGLHKCIARFITYSSPGRADTWFPALPRKECTSVRFVITKFSRMDGLPNFRTHGAPLFVFYWANLTSAALHLSHKLRLRGHNAFSNWFVVSGVVWTGLIWSQMQLLSTIDFLIFKVSSFLLQLYNLLVNILVSLVFFCFWIATCE